MIDAQTSTVFEKALNRPRVVVASLWAFRFTRQFIISFTRALEVMM